MKTFKEYMIEEYDVPLGYDKLCKDYPQLAKCPIHSWRAKQGIELIHKEPSQEELDRIWKNWNLMTDEQKEMSDKISLKIFGITNKEHYRKLSNEIV